MKPILNICEPASTLGGNGWLGDAGHTVSPAAASRMCRCLDDVINEFRRILGIRSYYELNILEMLEMPVPCRLLYETKLT